MSDEPEVLFEVRGGVGFVRLNRPGALNALSLTLIEAFDAKLRAWARDPAVHAVVVRGAGERAFCAGGDIRGIWEGGQIAEGSGDGPASMLFRREYMLIRRIKVFPKPYVALIGGIAMGGGVGLCVHGSHRVATERTMMALPETRIGLFPDVGSSYFLPRLAGALGLYLGLTGARLKAADACYAGLADHYVETARLAELENALAAADWYAGAAGSIVSAVILDFESPPGAAVLAEQRAAIDRCFGQNSIQAMIAALQAEGGDWAGKTLETLRACSPTSLKVTIEQLRRGAALDFDDAIVVEYRLSQAFLARHDFHEGIRAVVIDKDNAPRWDPAELVGVTQELVEAHFAPLGARDLSFD
jgi:enoyl-CoA hydratase